VDIFCSKENSQLNVKLCGRLDSASFHDLEATLKEEIKGMDELVFDFSQLEYLSSAGLRVLLASHKLMSGKMKILNVNEMIIDIFNMTGMSTIFDITRG